MDAAIREAIRRGDCELIPDSVSEADVLDDIHARTHKAGLTNRQGESCRPTGKIMSRGFGESKLNVWPRDKNGKLIE